ncbi:GNAT family N-acetyltransferase [Pontibacter sp. G13]|uniref:GNAT family N-acetyltransferase n=1 Tax=Pontibacter sp. G13 TaxID=3074898 RepID=UPI002889AA49|nr:GNAT family N-acetyltransferase [Pontibacter sp. G13]WNJ16825.1 GNAT family N-acetyltransferase [Pontibacter sp. G13]
MKSPSTTDLRLEVNGRMVRSATPSDFPAINGLLEQVDDLHVGWYPEYFRSVDPPARSDKHLTFWLEDPAREVLLAFDGIGLAGLAMLVLERPSGIPLLQDFPYVLIDNLVVDQSARGKGIGKALVEASQLWAKDLGVTQVQLKVYDKNQGAMKFYDHIGFEPLAHRLKLDLE